jgi:probable rRNA maturation factor
VLKIGSLPEIKISEETEGVVRKAAEKVLSTEESEDCEVSIFFTDDTEIHRLNKLYRYVDRPTDVLAFAMREGVDGELNQEILGDIVISLPRVEQQAKIYGHSFDVEMSLLVSHGVLHLLGYDHEQNNDRSVMQRKQTEILCSLGYDSDEIHKIRIGEPANGVER